MRKLLLLSVVLVTLPAAMCQTSDPGIEVRTVDVPVPSPCLPADQIPIEPAMVGDRLTGDLVRDLAIVSASALQLRGWGQTLHSALAACVD